MLKHAAGVLGGHAWTILADAKHRVQPVVVPPSSPWSIDIDDGHGGHVRLTGKHATARHADTVVLIVHGLGGSSESGYDRALARAAGDMGWSSLRIDLRGADGSGEDVYHAGLVDDLRAAIGSPALSGYRVVHVVGVSLGGHASLRLALHAVPRLGAVVAISSPLDLAESCRAIDRRRAFAYRHHVLRSLKASYRQVVGRHRHGPRVPSPLATVEAVRTIWDWDRTVVVPRHGFVDVSEYHASMSVGPHLRRLTRPALYVGSPFDPMVPGETVQPSLDAAGDALRVVMLDRGGHVGLPAPMLDRNAAPTLWAQVMAWLAGRSSGASG